MVNMRRFNYPTDSSIYLVYKVLQDFKYFLLVMVVNDLDNAVDFLKNYWN